MSGELSKNPLESPAHMLRDSINGYLDPNYRISTWKSTLQAPGEQWTQEIPELPAAIAGHLPAALPFDVVDGATGKLDYLMLVQQANSPDNDDLLAQSAIISREAGQDEKGAPIIASATLMRLQSFLPNSAAPDEPAEPVRQVVDTAMYGVALDTDSLGAAQYKGSRALFHQDTAHTETNPEDEKPHFVEADDQELNAIRELLDQELQAAVSPQTNDITPEDFM